MKSAEIENTFRALDAGAVASVEKPVGMGSPNFDAMVGNVVQTIKDMATIHLTRHRPPTYHGGPPVVTPRPGASVRLVVIGSSTGGPPGR